MEKINQADSSRMEAVLHNLDACISAAGTENGLTLGELADRLGEAGFCFVAMLLAVPFFQPMSLGPFTMASGGVFLLVGWQMGRGHHRLKLPDRARAWHLRGKGWTRVLKFFRKAMVWLSRWTGPRFSSCVDGPTGSRFVGWLIFIGGGLLAIPFANLPLNNTFPALMIFFAGLAWLEKDGIMALISLFWGLITLIYFAVAGWLLYYFGATAWDWGKSWWGG